MSSEVLLCLVSCTSYYPSLSDLRTPLLSLTPAHLPDRSSRLQRAQGVWRPSGPMITGPGAPTPALPAPARRGATLQLFATDALRGGGGHLSAHRRAVDTRSGWRSGANRRAADTRSGWRSGADRRAARTMSGPAGRLRRRRSFSSRGVPQYAVSLQPLGDGCAQLRYTI